MLRSSKGNRGYRAFSALELLFATGILGIGISMALIITIPMFRAPNQMVAKVDSLDGAVTGMYRIQRDLRMSDVNGVWICSTGPVSCSRPATTYASTTALAVISPMSGGAAQWSSSTGQAAWTGVQVYWLKTNSSGGSDLWQVFEAISGLGTGTTGAQSMTASQAQTAVTSALTSASAIIAAPNVTQLSVSAYSQIIGLKFGAVVDRGGRINETSFESDTFARN
jgi:hypothetical protein